VDGRERVGPVSADFLLELLSEEIPARMQASARNELARLFSETTGNRGLATGPVDVFSTPRRLALIARDVADATEATREEVKGPRTSAPEKAIEGFLRKTGLRRDQLEERDGILFAVVERPATPAAAVLQDAVRNIVANLSWPKSMRWGEASTSTGSLRWVRPLHGIVAMLGEAIVPVEIDGIKSGATTLGHRFHHPGAITVGGAQDYIEKLRACHVVVDQEERERIIREGAAKAANGASLALVEDEGLVVENAGLTEWPAPLFGRFDADYLDVPREVIVLTMRANQKYFACTGKDRGLAPAFVCIANIDAKDGGEAIVEGNRRVLAARLADARFFWEQDVKEPLEHQAAKLSGIVFHEKLGTVADKVERVAKLARWLAEEGIVKGAKPDQVERAARLAKADLVTGMVGEFPELQGVIGGYLAEAQGEPQPVAEAIRDHYKPVGQADEIPTAPVTVAVALADKLDTFLGFLINGEMPTGSSDPFALRRAALGVISILLGNRCRLELGNLVPVWLMFAAPTYDFAHVDSPEEIFRIETAIFKHEDWRDKLDSEAPGAYAHILVLNVIVFNFLLDRLIVQQRAAGVRHDVIAAVGAVADNDLVSILARVRALQDFVETGEGGDLLTAYKRAANILKREKWEGGSARAASDKDLEAEEAALVKALDAADPKAAAAVEKEDFTAAMAALASLRSPIDSFFDHVTVNDPDKGKRARRLNLLMRFRDAVHRVADFSRIEG